jgi:hypothetical protein
MLVENNTFIVNSQSGILKNAITGSAAVVVGNSFSGNGFNVITDEVKDVRDNIVERCKVAFKGVANCTGNNVKEADAYIQLGAWKSRTDGNNGTDGINGTTGNNGTVVIKGNNFSSSKKATITSSATSSINNTVEIAGNKFSNLVLTLQDASARYIIKDNELAIDTLDDIYIVGGPAAEFSNNKIMNMSGSLLITDKSEPSQWNFNGSVPIDTFISVESSSFAGYRKIALGKTADTWERVETWPVEN